MDPPCPQQLVVVRRYSGALYQTGKGRAPNRPARETHRAAWEHIYNDGMDRLNKFLAHAGLGSRRHVEDLIRAGRVMIDGQTVRDLSTRVEPGQEVRVDGHPLKAEKFTYWLVNKPRGVLSTNVDPGGRPRVADLVPHV